jgi:hypothetical protein
VSPRKPAFLAMIVAETRLSSISLCELQQIVVGDLLPSNWGRGKAGTLTTLIETLLTLFSSLVNGV